MLVAVVFLCYFVAWTGAVTSEECREKTNADPKISLIGCILCGDIVYPVSKLPIEDITTVDRLGKVQMKFANHLRRRLEDSSTDTAVVKAFSDIYDKGVWKGGGGSGRGSDRLSSYHSKFILMELFFHYGFTSMLDAPCGAVHGSWTRDFLFGIKSVLPCFKYHGLDAVGSVIDKNIAAYADFKDWMAFGQMDLSVESSDFRSISTGLDVILCRDALQHLPTKNIAGVINNFCKSNARYLLVTSYPHNTQNKEVPQIGNYFQNNLQIKPFNFPDPLESIYEGNHAINAKAGLNYLLLYKLEDMCSSDGVKNFLAKYNY